ncbi:MAG: hypothetical protein R2697_22500 [Ilumatobacteraceae bacterium]
MRSQRPGSTAKRSYSSSDRYVLVIQPCTPGGEPSGAGIFCVSLRTTSGSPPTVPALSRSRIRVPSM